MAYFKSIEKKCVDCHRRATVEVFGDRNESYGYFCLNDGKRRVSKMQKEKEEGSANRVDVRHIKVPRQ